MREDTASRPGPCAGGAAAGASARAVFAVRAASTVAASAVKAGELTAPPARRATDVSCAATTPGTRKTDARTGFTLSAAPVATTMIAEAAAASIQSGQRRACAFRRSHPLASPAATKWSMRSRRAGGAVSSPVSTADAAAVEAARPAANAADAAAPAQGPGLLAVSSRIPVDVYSRGRKIGASEGGEIVLSGGTHRIELVNRRFNYRDEVSLKIAPGELTSYSVSLPYGSVRIETTPGAEIWIEGERVGAAPLGDVPVAIGTREVVVRHADRRERRQPVEVRRGEVSVVAAVFEPAASSADAAAGMPALAAPSLHIIR